MESLLSISSMCFPYPNASELFDFRGSSSLLFLNSPSPSLSIKLKRSVTVAAKKAKKLTKEDKKGFRVGTEESTGFFPEAVLLKEAKVQEDGSVLPDFKDAEEEKLYEYLNLQLESELNVDQMRHYEVVYMIHEKFVDEVEAVNEKVQEFMREKKGRIWRQSDWGLRRLAYKIQKATQAHYMLMNIELDAKWINEFKTLLDKDERVIRHLTIKMDKAETEECPPPPEFHTVRADMVDEDEDEDDYDDEEYDDEDEEWEEGEEDEEEEGEEEEEDGDEDGVVLINSDDDEDGQVESGTGGGKGKRRGRAER